MANQKQDDFTPMLAIMESCDISNNLCRKIVLAFRQRPDLITSQQSSIEIDMQTASRPNRSRINVPGKNTFGNNRPQTKPDAKSTYRLPPAESKYLKPPQPASNEPLVMKKFVERFRNAEPQARVERSPLCSSIWWLNDESDKPELKNSLDEKPTKLDASGYSEISLFDMTPMRDDDNESTLKSENSLLDKTIDLEQVSSTGVGSTTSTRSISTTTTTTATLNTIGTYHPPVHERPARPLFTKLNDIDQDGSENTDILYLWRLRRRMEIAQENQNSSPPRIYDRVHIPQNQMMDVLPRQESYKHEPATIVPLPITKPDCSNLQEKLSDSKIAKESKEVQTSPKETREMAIQTLQDACVQTSIVVHQVTTKTSSSNSSDHDLKIEVEPRLSVDCSPSVRFDKRKQRTYKPSPKVLNQRIDPYEHENHTSNYLQLSRDSTLTKVTCMTIDENHEPSVHQLNGRQLKSSIIGQSVDYETNEEYEDEILDLLKQKYTELLSAYQEIQKCLDSDDFR